MTQQTQLDPARTNRLNQSSPDNRLDRSKQTYLTTPIDSTHESDPSPVNRMVTGLVHQFARSVWSAWRRQSTQLGRDNRVSPVHSNQIGLTGLFESLGSGSYRFGRVVRAGRVRQAAMECFCSVGQNFTKENYFQAILFLTTDPDSMFSVLAKLYGNFALHVSGIFMSEISRSL